MFKHIDNQSTRQKLPITLPPCYLELSFEKRYRRAMGAMNQQGSLGQQRKAQISNHKKIQTQSIKT